MLARRLPLTAYGIQNDPNINLAVKQLGAFQIMDREDEELFTMTVEPQDTIASVKEKLSEAEGTPYEYIQLYDSGTMLRDDERTLASLNIEVTDTVEAYFARSCYEADLEERLSW